MVLFAAGTSIASSVAPRMFEVQPRRYRRRSSRNRRREIRAAAIVIAAALAVVAAFVATVLFLGPLNEPPVVSLTTGTETVLANNIDLEPARDGSARPVYAFSVIPGGVYSADEFANAVGTDPAVAAHYGDVTPATLQVQTVDEPREAYMSYRVGDQIYWTKRKLPLHDGERVLSTGTVMIRARCGNRLSDEPMVPTSDAEPPVLAFDGDPPPPIATELLEDIQPLLPLATLLPLGPEIGPLSSPDAWGSVPLLGGVGVFGGAGTPLDDQSVGSPVDDEDDRSIEFVFPTGDGRGSDPTGDDEDTPSVTVEIPGLDDHPSDGGPHEPPLGGPNLPGGRSDPELPPPVVPEPTSMTLFGTGAVWLAITRYRSRRRSL